MKPILSVIIVTFNHEKEIANCIDSLVQHLPSQPTEIVIIDNHSSDTTISLIEKKISQLKAGPLSIYVVKNRLNLGYTKAMNQGLKQSSGRFILFLNPDTEITAKSIGFLVQFLSNHPQAGAVAPQLRFHDGTIQPSCRRFPRYRYIVFELFALHRIFKKSKLFNGWKMGDFDHQSVRMVDQPQGACLLVRKDVIIKIGNLDERFFMFFSDVDLCRQIYNAGYAIYFCPSVQVVHVKGSSVYANRSKMIWLSHSDFIRYFLKWYRSIAWIWNMFGIPLLVCIGIVRWVLFRIKESFSKKRKRSNKKSVPVQEWHGVSSEKRQMSNVKRET